MMNSTQRSELCQILLSAGCMDSRITLNELFAHAHDFTKADVVTVMKALNAPRRSAQKHQKRERPGKTQPGICTCGEDWMMSGVDTWVIDDVFVVQSEVGIDALKKMLELIRLIPRPLTLLHSYVRALDDEDITVRHVFHTHGWQAACAAHEEASRVVCH